jgi:hypothetical protein
LIFTDLQTKLQALMDKEIIKKKKLAWFLDGLSFLSFSFYDTVALLNTRHKKYIYKPHHDDATPAPGWKFVAYPTPILCLIM